MNKTLSRTDIYVSPYRLSGVVYGVLLNHEPALEALGTQVHELPYKEPPKAPVLYMKPRNTLACHGDTVVMPSDASELEAGAALGIVIGRTACRLNLKNAMEHVGGYTIVNDVSVVHDSYYRPSIRFKARDGFCPLGPVVVPRKAVENPDDLLVSVYVNDALVQSTTTGQRRRRVAQLLVDVTNFMTLNCGDVLMLGVSLGAPRVHEGDEVRIDIEGVGSLVNRVGRVEGAQA